MPMHSSLGADQLPYQLQVEAVSSLFLPFWLEPSFVLAPIEFYVQTTECPAEKEMKEETDMTLNI